jgi:ornithine decarboxylase
VSNSKRHVEAIEACKVIINQSQQKGINIRVLDIGGGFPVDYVTGKFDIYEFCGPI